MTRRTVIGTSALALLAGVSIAAAQGMNGANQAQQGQSAQGDINLTDQQKQTIWQTLSRARSEKAPSSFKATVGSDVPRTVRLHVFTRALTNKVPATRGYEYAKLQNQVVVVDPKTRRIIGTVSGS
ncbi:MAG TPA: DUF1236 domain-containing protein [Xanthobacteraceae bacterium]|jgi:hypothetical protein